VTRDKENKSETRKALEHYAKRKLKTKALKTAGKAGKVAAKAAYAGAKIFATALTKLLLWLLSLIGIPGLIISILFVPILIILLSMPGGDNEEIQRYKTQAEELGINWQEFVAFNMARYNNKLEKGDPKDSAYYFLELDYRKYNKKGKLISQKIIKGKENIKKFFKSQGLDLDDSIAENIRIIDNKPRTNLYVNILSLDEAMDQANFTKKQIGYVRTILALGTLNLYGSVSSSEMTPGMCVGDVGPNGKAKVSAKTEKWRPLVTKYAQQFGMEAYIDWMLAMIQQESSGNGPDIMQASESSEFNKKYCHKPNCIKDPDYSVYVGVQTWKASLARANGDMMVAIQSYNFGPYFATWIKEHGGTYTLEAAKKYSKEVLSKYGMTGTPSHALKVLQYYINPGCVVDGGMPSGEAGDLASKVATVGNKWIGHSKYVFGGGRSQSDINAGRFDCSSFVHWAYKQVGIDLGPLGSVSTETLKNKGTQIPASQIRVGDIIFYDTYKKNGHVVIVRPQGL
jgi:hypothetical protein